MRKIFLLLIPLLLQSCNDNKHEYQGYVACNNTYISSKFSGNLINLNVKKGDTVSKGTLLYTLDLEPHNFSLNEARSMYRQAISKLDDLKKPKRDPYLNSIKAKIKQVESEITLAKLRVNRNQTLYNKKVLAKDSLDASTERLNQLLARKSETEEQLKLAMLGARADIISAQESKIRSLESKIKNLEWVISEKKGYAPVDGYVYDTYYVEGEFVKSSVPILSIINEKNIYIEFFLPYREIKNINVGDKIKYSNIDDYKNQHSAEISYISPESEYIPPLVYSRDNMDKIVFKIKAEPLNREKLFPGLPLKIIIGKSNAK